MPQSHFNNPSITSIMSSLLAANSAPEFQASLTPHQSTKTTSLRDVSDQTIVEFLGSSLEMREGVQETDATTTHSPTSPLGSPFSTTPTSSTTLTPPSDVGVLMGPQLMRLWMTAGSSQASSLARLLRHVANNSPRLSFLCKRRGATDKG
eukprot:jgi/Chlat1/5517/Chrsp360S05334